MVINLLLTGMILQVGKRGWSSQPPRPSERLDGRVRRLHAETAQLAEPVGELVGAWRLSVACGQMRVVVYGMVL